LHPERTEGALVPLLRAIRSHLVLMTVVILAAVSGSVAWLMLRSPDYEATASILVTPLPPEDPTFLGIQVLRADTTESTRTLQTAASLVESPRAAELTAEAVGEGWSPDRVRDSVEVEPEGQTNILSITAQADGPARASEVANRYARAALEARREELSDQIQAAIEQVRAQLSAIDPANTEAVAEATARLGQLQAVSDGRDPTLALSEVATEPDAPVGAAPWLVIMMSLLAGVTLGTAAALLLELLDRRVRDDDELLSLYALPILGHVPKLSRRVMRRRPSALSLPPAAREAFRTAQVELDRRGAPPRVIMLTSASTGDGKTTCAISLATALVGAGHRVVLIDFDLRKPDVGKALGLEPKRPLVSLLASEEAKLEDLLVSTPDLPPLRVVPAGTDGDLPLLEALSRRLPALIEEVRSLADYIVIDTAPLGEVSDALRLMDHADEIIVVARPQNTNRSAFELMRDLIDRTGHTPSGLLVIGDTPARSSSYYAYGLASNRKLVGPPVEARSGRR
jgi:capsular exopolysaccharide synthesis family protein